MSEPDFDPLLQLTAQHIAELSGRVHIDPQHKARLREELLRRHQELSAGSTQRAAGMLWPRFARLKRLTLVAPPALAAGVICSILLWALQISGHQSSQAAEAARITQALTRTVPTVTMWQVQLTLRQVRDDSTSSYQCVVKFHPDERLYLRNGQVYLYFAGAWHQVTLDQAGSQCPADWQWAFTSLPARLSQDHPTFAPARSIDHRPTEQISYTVAVPGQPRIVKTAMWVDRQTGLVLRLERVTLESGKVIERDSANYHYGYRPWGAP